MSLNNQVLDKPLSYGLPSVEANLSYLIPMAEKPVNYTYEPPPGVPRTNGIFQTYKLPIYNARSISEKISLDEQGFAFTTYNTSVRDFYDEEEIRRVYYPEAEQLLKELTGASQVVIFDTPCVMRRNQSQVRTTLKSRRSVYITTLPLNLAIHGRVWS